tara:strand:- start:109 stop:534 length:426 start_codon:yes stop_codon:yes gene_type:complete
MSKQLTPQEFQEKHARRLKASTEDIRAGIEAVTTSPTAKAADKAEKMKQNWLAKMNDGTIVNRLRAVSLEDWKAKAANVGVNRIPEGIDGASAKVVDFAGQLLPYVYRVSEEVRRMPDLTLEDSINRMTKEVREMAKFRKK